MSKYLFLTTASLALAAPACAAPAPGPGGDDIVVADPVRADIITVVATGSQTRLDWLGQPITVIGADEIARIQGPDLTRVLERAPGVAMARSGGLGSQTAVRVRGAEAEQLLVLIDGVRVNDVSSPGGAYDFGTLLAGGIERIDLLRGSNSVVWGSQAVGGVLAVTSRDPAGLEARAEYGADRTFDGQASAGIAGARGALALSGGYTRSDGFSAAAGGTEPDGFRQWRGAARGRFDLNGNLALVASGRYADSRTDIDGYPAPAYRFADTPEYQATREASGRAGLRLRSDALDLDAGFGLSDTRRDYYDPTVGSGPQYGYVGRSERADLTGRYRFAGPVAVDFGTDSEWTRFRSTFDAEAKARLSSAHALLGYYGPALSIAGGVRQDDHSRFGGATTLGANASYALGAGWRLKGSWGQGFKAPTLYQLFSDYGNEALTPERSTGFDGGIERGDRNGALHVALTGFRRDTRDQIGFASCFGVTGGLCASRPFGYYANLGRTRAEGVELELGASPTPRLHAQAAYTYLHAFDRDTRLDLARRPRHTLFAGLDWATPLGVALGADARLVGDSFDDAGHFTALDGFATLTLRASLPLGDRLEVYGRVENVTDARAQTVAGYGWQGRAAYGGVRLRL
ncbi:TonB-dependent receptor plug domain-containing protein [Parablastomonas sp. CN1-191]|uniref:TonB-dependent receptor plug domain-containing protein n=1 Tax=Parablastomonas sp. CN1-191 TaxID=3400908 RepID=UPI003BF8ACEE